MITVALLLMVLSSLLIGGFLGWYFNDIRERLKTIAWLQHKHDEATHERSAVVKPISPREQPQGGASQSSGVVRAKTPKQVAAEQNKRFNSEFEV